MDVLFSFSFSICNLSIMGERIEVTLWPFSDFDQLWLLKYCFIVELTLANKLRWRMNYEIDSEFQIMNRSITWIFDCWSFVLVHSSPRSENWIIFKKVYWIIQRAFLQVTESIIFTDLLTLVTITLCCVFNQISLYLMGTWNWKSGFEIRFQK